MRRVFETTLQERESLRITLRTLSVSRSDPKCSNGGTVKNNGVSKNEGFLRHGERFARPLGEPYYLYMGNSVPDFISY